MDKTRAIQILTEATNCGPARYWQIEPDIYDVYHAFRFDPKTVSPAEALAALLAE